MNMRKLNTRKWIGFSGGALCGITALSLSMGAVAPGSVFKGRVTDDTALYQSLSEIRVKKEAKLDFDGDIARLSRSERAYREKLPRLSNSQKARLSAPMQRVERMKYTYAGRTAPK